MKTMSIRYNSCGMRTWFHSCFLDDPAWYDWCSQLLRGNHAPSLWHDTDYHEHTSDKGKKLYYIQSNFYAQHMNCPSCFCWKEMAIPEKFQSYRVLEEISVKNLDHLKRFSASFRSRFSLKPSLWTSEATLTSIVSSWWLDNPGIAVVSPSLWISDVLLSAEDAGTTRLTKISRMSRHSFVS